MKYLNIRGIYGLLHNIIHSMGRDQRTLHTDRRCLAVLHAVLHGVLPTLGPTQLTRHLLPVPLLHLAGDNLWWYDAANILYCVQAQLRPKRRDVGKLVCDLVGSMMMSSPA